MQLSRVCKAPRFGQRFLIVWFMVASIWLIAFTSAQDKEDSVARSAANATLANHLSTGPVQILNVDGVTELVTIGKTEFRHSESITSIAFVPRRGQVVTTARDATARLWDVQTGRELRRFYLADNSAVWYATVDPGGRDLFTCNSAGNVTRWNLETGEKLAVYDTTVRVFRMAIFPDGKRFIAVGNSGYAAIWDIETVKQLKRLRPQAGDLYGVDIDPAGNRIVTCGEPGAVVWSVEGGPRLLELKCGDADVFTAKFSPDGKRIATCDGKGMVRVYDATAANPIWQKKFGEDVKVIDWSADGSQLAVSVLKSGVTIVDSRNGQTIKVFKQVGATYWPVVFSSDGRQVYAGADRDLVCWEIASGQQVHSLKSPLLPVRKLQSLAFTSDLQQILLKEADSKIYRWDLQQGRLTRAKQSNQWRQIAASPDGKYLAICHAAGVSETSEASQEDQEDIEEIIEIIEEIEIEESEPVVEQKADATKEIKGEAVHEVFMARKIKHDDEISLRILNGNDFSERATITLPIGAIESMQFINDGQLLLVQLSGQRLQVWDPATGDLHWDFDIPINSIDRLITDESSPYVVVNYEEHEAVYVLDAVHRRTLGELQFNSDEIADCLFLPDNRGMVLAEKRDGQSNITFWKGRIPDEVQRLSSAEIAALLHSMTGSDYADRESATRQLIDEGPEILQQLQPNDDANAEFCWRVKYIQNEIERSAMPRTATKQQLTMQRPVSSIVAHPDGQHIAFVAGNDANAEICLAAISAEGLELKRRFVSGHSPKELKFSYDGSMLLVDNNDGTVSVFRCR